MRPIDERMIVQPEPDPPLISDDDDGEAGACEQPDGIDAERIDVNRRVGRQIPELVEDRSVAIEEDCITHP